METKIFFSRESRCPMSMSADLMFMDIGHLLLELTPGRRDFAALRTLFLSQNRRSGQERAARAASSLLYYPLLLSEKKERKKGGKKGVRGGERIYNRVFGALTCPEALFSTSQTSRISLTVNNMAGFSTVRALRQGSRRFHG